MISMTEKLYYEDAYLREFTAVVTGCTEAEEGFAVTLDRTAFFPEGGGQRGDTGFLNEVRVTDVQERGGAVLHYTAAPVPVGERVAGWLDFEQRLRRMQNHSGEHVISGLAHMLYGCENVGFHMGGDCMTMDYDRELGWEELERIERLANETVRGNLPIRCYFPEPETLASLVYRSKLALTEGVRLVEIEGVDRCACCAPHVSRTGEIGAIKLLDAQRHRGGTRVSAVCGMDALEDYCRRQESAARISALLSVPRDEVAPAVERLLHQQERQKERIAALSMALAQTMAEALPETAGNLCVFDDVLDEIALRELVNRMAEKCGGVAAAFSGGDGGWRYIIGSRHVDLRAQIRVINAAIDGRGGGSAAMLQGRAGADRETIRKFFEKQNFDTLL